ncbi:MAG: hypothetical protein ABT20_15155 [Rubrivivax sp. SCN 70-15]|nr:MAG: hypothetical protein ABT20_15155 [Rubrivivax sp. SCN 70-15]
MKRVAAPHHRRPPRGGAARPRGQRGIAALVTVLVLFFIVALVAAYASRNLIFEQRTAANQYRSTAAIEAAEAGLEWALAMLNHGRIDAACATSSSTADTSFRQRYLNIDASTGSIAVRKTSTGADLLPSCVFDGTGRSGAPTLAAPSDSAVHPAFRIRFKPLPGTPSQPGLVQVESVACTRLDPTCLTFPGTPGAVLGVGNEGRAYVTALVGLTGGATSPPAAALTALGRVALAGGAIHGDVAVQAGGTVSTDPSMTLTRSPGSPGSPAVLASQAALSALSPERFFAAQFNLWSQTFRQQPAAVVLDCSSSSCDAATLRQRIALNPGRPIWVDGSLAIDSGGNIGSADSPVLLVVTGSVAVTASDATIHGLLYVQTADWPDAGALQVQGAVAVEGDLDTGTPQIAYDPALINRLRLSTGSFVLVPGSWHDFYP